MALKRRRTIVTAPLRKNNSQAFSNFRRGFVKQHTKRQTFLVFLVSKSVFAEAQACVCVQGSLRGFGALSEDWPPFSDLSGRAV